MIIYFESLFNRNTNNSGYLFSNIKSIYNRDFLIFTRSININLTYRIARQYYASCLGQYILNKYLKVQNDFSKMKSIRNDLEKSVTRTLMARFHLVADLISHQTNCTIFEYIDYIIIFKFLKLVLIIG